MFRRLIIPILISLFTIVCSSVSAMAYEFDATYYANKYPDVVLELGNDPAALLQHYQNFGSNEGRFMCRQEEIDSMLNPDAVEANKANSVAAMPGNGTYIDINIASQTVNYYEGGELKLSSPCVTGNVNNGNGTPTGTFAINTLTPGKFLTGPTWNVWVDRWMRFTPDQNIGLHDASWRSNFGGDIYLTNGSHGCVNLPHDVAMQLFDMAQIGTTVVVH